jgi:hypothetical protein
MTNDDIRGGILDPVEMWGVGESAAASTCLVLLFVYFCCDHESASFVDLAQPAATVFKAIVHLHPYPLCGDPYYTVSKHHVLYSHCRNKGEHSQCRVEVPLFLTGTVQCKMMLKMMLKDPPKLGAPFWIFLVLHYASCFPFVSRNYMTSGLFFR